MKLRIMLGLALMLCCFFAGGLYIYKSVSSMTLQLEQLTTFHQVESLRESLENRIRLIQSDLILSDSDRPAPFGKIISDAEELYTTANQCHQCHHNDTTSSYIEQIGRQTDLYLKNISRSLTMRGYPERLQQLQEETYHQGESLLNLAMRVTELSTLNVEKRTQIVRNSVDHTRQIVAVLLVVGPLAVLIVSWFFLQRFSGALTSLTRGTEELEKGNLDYRITDPLKNEFHLLAHRFNKMAASLSREKKYTESVQKLYRILFESAQEAICIIETRPQERGRILSVNPAASRLYGYSIEELKTMHCSDLAPANEAAEFRQRLDNMQKGNWVLTTVTRKRKDGSTFPAEISGGPMHIDEHTYILIFARDISEREQAKKELLHANQLAVAGQMAVGLAHEIKNPLAGIKTTVEVLSADLELDPEDRELFERIVGEVARMERLLKNLLKFARPPQPQVELIDLHRLLDYTMKNVEVTAIKSAAQSVRLVRDFDSHSILIKADSSQVQQVLLNLYLNAVEALQHEGEITTRTRIVAAEGCVCIDIEDNGPGIPPATLENIFTPFFTTKSRGTGLGLPICQRLIEQHDGKIEVSSEPGKGTRFVISLPMAQRPEQQGEHHE
ncbi:MAG: ATP-binding protein [Pelovirga sp.]